MDRDFRNGCLELDFPTEPFTGPLTLLLASVRLFFRTFPFLAAITLAVFLPGKLLVHFASYLADVPQDGILSYFLMEISDLFLGALAAPAIVYGLVQYGRKRKPPRPWRKPSAGDAASGSARSATSSRSKSP